MNVLIQIGNSDDKLSQADWSYFVSSVRLALDQFTIHGEWFSLPDKPWQNANWCVEINHEGLRKELKKQLAELAKYWKQDSIAWTEGEVEFIKG